MDTATDTTPESKPQGGPWEPLISAALTIVRATPIEPFGYHHLRIGGLTLQLGYDGGDEEVVEVIDRLLEPLQELRSAALRRLAAKP